MRTFCHHLIDLLITFVTFIDPNTSEEAKERAKTELGKHGVDVE